MFPLLKDASSAVVVVVVVVLCIEAIMIAAMRVYSVVGKVIMLVWPWTVSGAFRVMFVVWWCCWGSSGRRSWSWSWSWKRERGSGFVWGKNWWRFRGGVE